MIKLDQQFLNGIPTDLVLNTSIIGNGTGYSIDLADVNADSIDEVIIGAPGSSQSYLVSGKAIQQALQNGTTSLDLDNLGNQGLILQDSTGIQGVGRGLGTADINNDGIEDILLGAPSANPVIDSLGNTRGTGGIVYAVFGGSNLTFGTTFNLESVNGI